MFRPPPRPLVLLMVPSPSSQCCQHTATACAVASSSGGRLGTRLSLGRRHQLCLQLRLGRLVAHAARGPGGLAQLLPPRNPLPQRLVLGVARLQLLDPLLRLRLLLLLPLQCPLLPLLFPVVGEVDAAANNGHDGKALREHTRTEHALGLVVVALADGAGGVDKGGDGHDAADGNERFFEQLAAESLQGRRLIFSEGWGEGRCQQLPQDNERERWSKTHALLSNDDGIPSDGGRLDMMAVVPAVVPVAAQALYLCVCAPV
ncbi:uncharacterized protein SPSK_06543 [Sporothrix schenckii 1099-18]|uniref:Uncharacterized protein n=1 Tax=Sporothrix schenckii 1099-18 TaxID=1397361 RepID=A0A0F2MJV5_SPOSC|nr:uncharacterized protein SPSK_06543 [Sporothrix schenckii 1099-18]KJR89359.1 hypothetical protein SPSK_06543 [Sporothrix schenckii 1099-18]